MAIIKWVIPIVAFLILGNLRFAQGQSNYTTLATFHGQMPKSLILDDQGNIFGTTINSNGDSGIVFEIKKGSQTVNTIAAFQGNAPISIVLDGSGNIFGTTVRGPSPVIETIYEIVKGSHTITTLATSYEAPYGKLFLDAEGNIFGTIGKFGSKSFSVFEMKKGDHTLTVLASINGDDSSDRLSIDSQGNIFGTIANFDINNPFVIKGGSIFEVNGVSHQVSTLTTFHGEASRGISLDKNGNIFGIKGNFSDNPESTIFELDKGTHTIIPLATFHSLCANVILDSRGNIFGVKYDFGRNDRASIFKLIKGTHSVISLATFQGEVPSEIILDDSGTIFGYIGSTPPKGGSIFEIPHDSKAH